MQGHTKEEGHQKRLVIADTFPGGRGLGVLGVHPGDILQLLWCVLCLIRCVLATYSVIPVGSSDSQNLSATQTSLCVRCN